jgi:hypothetical protein
MGFVFYWLLTSVQFGLFTPFPSFTPLFLFFCYWGCQSGVGVFVGEAKEREEGDVFVFPFFFYLL